MGILVNGNGNPHVYAHQDSDLIAGIVGNQTSIMPVGDKFEANQEDANTIALSSGVIITKEGRRIQLDAGTIDEFIIPTGAQDVQSFYIIGYHLYEDGNSDQLCETFVRKMDSASDTIPESTFRSGATEVYVSLYRVTQDSLNITDIDLLLPYADSIAEVKRNGGNKNLAAIEDGSTASQPYVAGEFVIVGGQFCEVTASISTNDAFIAYPLPNYNIKAGTVGEQITALNQNLTYRWNPTTDYFEYFANGSWHNDKKANILWDGYIYNRGAYDSDHFAWDFNTAQLQGAEATANSQMNASNFELTETCQYSAQYGASPCQRMWTFKKAIHIDRQCRIKLTFTTSGSGGVQYPTKIVLKTDTAANLSNVLLDSGSLSNSSTEVEFDLRNDAYIDRDFYLGYVVGNNTGNRYGIWVETIRVID